MDSLVIIPILLFSVVVHEVSHGWMALRLGDPTARDMGRLTLNPIPHIDPIGSILVPLVSYLTAGSVFIAWAKPVPVNPMNFSKARRDDILVSVVGPISNLFVALGCTVLFIAASRVFGPVGDLPAGLEQSFATYLMRMFSIGITLNIFLAVFNLLPIPPLDGSHVMASLLPERIGSQVRRIGFGGILLIIVLMRFDAVRSFVWSLVSFILLPYKFLIALFA